MFVFPSSPASYPRDELRGLMDEMRDASNTVAYAKFISSDPNGCVAVCLCGNGERFQTLKLFENVACDCFVVQDPFSPWFTGSPICGGIDEIEIYIRESFPKAHRYIFAGQSSGGYAALLLSRRFPNNITIAFAPQTFSDAATKNSRVSFPPSFNIEKTPDIVDLQAYFRSCQSHLLDSRVFIIASFSEYGNPPEGFFWCDYLHWTRMLEFPEVRVVLTGNNIHPLLWRNSFHYANLIGLLSVGSAISDHDLAQAVQLAAFSSPATANTV